jgi:uncharacterized membrane protein
MSILVTVFVLAALLLIVLAIPLIQRRIKPNHFYGLRVPATFADEWVWYEANARSGRDLLVLGIIELALAIGLAAGPNITPLAYALVNAALLATGSIGLAGLGIFRANRLLRTRPQTSRTA